MIIGTFAISFKIAPIVNYKIEGYFPIESINKLLEYKPLISGIVFPKISLSSNGLEIHSENSHSHDYANYEVVSFSKTRKIKLFDKNFS